MWKMLRSSAPLSVTTMNSSSPSLLGLIRLGSAPTLLLGSNFPSSIDGDLLKQVHLSNAFRMVKGLYSRAAGGEICICGQHRTWEGRQVKGHVYRHWRSSNCVRKTLCSSSQLYWRTMCFLSRLNPCRRWALEVNKREYCQASGIHFKLLPL